MEICHKLKYYYDRRVILKIQKLDQKGQYGFAMTKPISTGCIKEKTPFWTEFNLLI